MAAEPDDAAAKPKEDLDVDAVFAKLKQIGGKAEEKDEPTSVRPEHAVDKPPLDSPLAQLAVLPGTDHYTLVESDWLLSMIETFLDTPAL